VKIAFNYCIAARVFANEKIVEQRQEELTKTDASLCSYYPFLSLLYLLIA